MLTALILAAVLPGLPKLGDEQAFVPRGWAIESREAGELNGPSVVLVLLEAEHGDDARRRALVVLKREKTGFSLLGSNVGLVACFGCQGQKGGDAAPEISIENRVLVVSQFGGGFESAGTTHRFRFEKTGLRLIGFDRSCRGCPGAVETSHSENLLTGAVVDEVTATEDGPVKRTRSKKPVAKLPALEDLNDSLHW